MRFLALAATLAALPLAASSQDASGAVSEATPLATTTLGATPEASGASVVILSEPEPKRVTARDAERAVTPEAERRNVVLGVLGGEGLAVGLGYERRLGGGFIARTGLQYYNNGVDISGRFVPLSIGGVARLGGRWSADASGGATFAFMHSDGEAVPEFGIEAEPDDYLRVVPAIGAGVRYETDRLLLRGGAALFPARFDRIAGEPAKWTVYPWPSVSAGYRF